MMNKYFSHFIAFIFGSTLVYAAPDTFFKAPEATEKGDKTICLMNTKDEQMNECEAHKPGEEYDRISPVHTSKNAYSFQQNNQEVIQQEILRSMFEPINFQS